MTAQAPNRPPAPFRLPQIPIRVLAPNLVTLLALCSGLTSIKLAMEGRLELALWCILVAAILDAADGRLARLLKGTSKFGAELDSLTDFVNFGCAPALILYIWILNQAGNAGWIAALIFAIAGALRLARFNVMVDDPDRPAFASNFFTGVPAPAGALCVLLPIYLVELGWPKSAMPASAVLIYTLAIGALMVSQVPTYAAKKMGAIRREYVVVLLLCAAALVGLLAAYTWLVLAVATLLYLAMIPVGMRWYQQQERAWRESQQAKTSVTPAPPAGT